MNFNSLAGFCALAFAALFLGSCAVVVDEEPGRPFPPGPPGPQFCTQEYAPVCAARGNQRRTFGNACMADAEGFRPVHRGECRAGSRPPSGGPQACTREYRPVCAVRGNQRRTFGNACQAEASNFRIIRPGEC